MARHRHAARIAVLQALYARRDQELPALQSALQLTFGLNKGADEPFATDLLDNCFLHREACEKLIGAHTADWKLEEIDQVSFTIMWIGTTELIMNKETELAPAIIINEAVELCKEFGTDEGRKFVHGVLNAITQEVCPK
jgi:N utilization substance protein B